jgi:hypothetical protein
VSNMLQSILLQAEQSMHIFDTFFGISHDSLPDMETIVVSVMPSFLLPVWSRC